MPSTAHTQLHILMNDGGGGVNLPSELFRLISDIFCKYQRGKPSTQMSLKWQLMIKYLHNKLRRYRGCFRLLSLEVV